MTARKPTPINGPRTYQDLMRVTGLGQDLVKAAIRSGELPGYVVGTRYVVPAEAFDAFCRGAWTPQPRPVSLTPIRPLLARKRETA